MKIVILDGYCAIQNDLNFDSFKKFGEVVYYDRTEKNEVDARLVGADIALTNKCVLSAENIEKSSLKYIGVLATGYNVVDIEAAKCKGIPVCNIPAYSTPSVAQLVFALLLEYASRVSTHNDAVHRGEWTSSKDFCFVKAPIIELCGKTFGIYGCGQIGLSVARIAAAFGMKTIGYSRSAKIGELRENVLMVSEDELIANSDILSFHCSLNQSNTGLVNKQFINNLKNGAVIINTARGGIINETDVAAALNSGKLAAYLTDVLSCEPPKKDNPLLSAPNALITPHIAWASREARIRLLEIATQNIESFIGGNAINNVAK